VVTEQAVKLKYIATGANKQVRNSAVPVGERNGINELFDMVHTIPYQSQMNDTMNVSMLLHLHPINRAKNKKTKKE